MPLYTECDLEGFRPLDGIFRMVIRKNGDYAEKVYKNSEILQFEYSFYRPEPSAISFTKFKDFIDPNFKNSSCTTIWYDSEKNRSAGARGFEGDDEVLFQFYTKA